MKMSIHDAELDEATFRRLSDFIYRQTGILMPPKKRVLLANRLRRRLANLSLQDYSEYYNYLLRHKEEEINALMDAVSTNETYMNRTPAHFAMLSNYILPEISRAGSEKIQIWSAGCSTGEEVYDLAIHTYEFFLRNPKRDFIVMGTDISTEALQTAQKGVYSGRKIAKLDPYLRTKYFQKSDVPEGSFDKVAIEVRPLIREYTLFRQLNLIRDPYPIQQHIIFCRNVMIYFDRRTQTKIVNHFYAALRTGGFLVIGPSESMHILESKFERVRLPEGTVYRKA